jgi:hypothetical protein
MPLWCPAPSSPSHPAPTCDASSSLAGRKISGAAWAVASCSHCRGRALTDGHPKRDPKLAGGISHRFATAKDKLPGRGGGKNPGLSRKPAAVQRRQPPVKQGGYPVPRPSGGGTLWVGRPPHRWLRFATPLANFSLHSGQRWSRVTRAGNNPCRLCRSVSFPPPLRGGNASVVGLVPVVTLRYTTG